jgi:hypothetical protein
MVFAPDCLVCVLWIYISEGFEVMQILGFVFELSAVGLYFCGLESYAD